MKNILLITLLLSFGSPAIACPKDSLRFSFQNIPVINAMAILADFAGLQARLDPSIKASQPLKFECRNWLEVAEELAATHNLNLTIENGVMTVTKK